MCIYVYNIIFIYIYIHIYKVYICDANPLLHFTLNLFRLCLPHQVNVNETSTDIGEISTTATMKRNGNPSSSEIRSCQKGCQISSPKKKGGQRVGQNLAPSSNHMRGM